MILQLQNINYKNIILFDIEYDKTSLIQVAFIILGAKGSNMFELQESFNVYIKPNHLLSRFFVQYTNITDAYLRDNGVDLTGARALVDRVVFNIEPGNTLLVGHGIDNDMRLLDNCKINLSRFFNRYDTYKKAKQILKRNTNLTLTDLAAEDGYFIFNEHNAYADVWALLHSFCMLNRMENENEII